MRLIVLAVLGSAGAVSVARADFQSYADRPSWLVAAGLPGFSETFAGRPQQNFYTVLGGPITLAGGALRLGAESNPAFTAANYIDPFPFSAASTSHGAYARATVVFGDAQDARTTIFIDFPTPISSFGFQTWSAASSQGVIMDAFNGSAMLGSVSLDNLDGSFRGFVSNTGVTRVELRAAASSPGVAELFALDDLEGSAIPSPGCFWPAAAAGLVIRRRRRLG